MHPFFPCVSLSFHSVLPMVSFLKVMVFKATVSECHRARLVSSPVSSPDYFCCVSSGRYAAAKD